MWFILEFIWKRYNFFIVKYLTIKNNETIKI